MNTYGTYVNNPKQQRDEDGNTLLVKSFIDGSNLIEIENDHLYAVAGIELTSVQMIELGKILIENGQKQIDLREE